MDRAECGFQTHAITSVGQDSDEASQQSGSEFEVPPSASLTKPHIPKKRGTPHRTLKTCRQCREAKRPCSRDTPCTYCFRRGLQCDWTGAVPREQGLGPGRFATRKESKELRERIATLESMLLQHIAEANYDPPLTLLQPSPDQTKGQQPFHSLELGAAPSSGPTQVEVDISVDDLATRLASLGLAQALPGVRESTSGRVAEAWASGLLQECESAVVTAEPKDGRSAPAGASYVFRSIYGSEVAVNTLSDILDLLPMPLQAEALLEEFEFSWNSLHRAVHFPTFQRELSAFWRNPQSGYNGSAGLVKIAWLAGYFAVCALAVWHLNTSDERCQKHSLPVDGAERRTLAIIWLKCAVFALDCAELHARPTVEGIRSLFFVIHFSMFSSNPDELGRALSYLDIAIDLSRKIKLDSDPYDNPALENLSDLEKNLRRALMVGLLTAAWIIGMMADRTWNLQNPAEFTVRSPCICEESDFDEQGKYVPRSSGLHVPAHAIDTRFKIAKISHDVLKLFGHRHQRLPHSHFLDVDAALCQVERELPECLRLPFDAETGNLQYSVAESPAGLTFRAGTLVTIASAYVRLHRTFLTARDGVAKEDIVFHRKKLYRYARILLAIQRGAHEGQLDGLPYLAAHFVCINAAIALSIWCFTAPIDLPERAVARRELAQALKSLDGLSHSSVVRRGAPIIRLILEVDQRRSDPAAHASGSGAPQLSYAAFAEDLQAITERPSSQSPLESTPEVDSEAGFQSAYEYTEAAPDGTAPPEVEARDQ